MALEHVFPVHAGMNRLALLVVYLQPRIPRTRGDEPFFYEATVGMF